MFVLRKYGHMEVWKGRKALDSMEWWDIRNKRYFDMCCVDSFCNKVGGLCVSEPRGWSEHRASAFLSTTSFVGYGIRRETYSWGRIERVWSKNICMIFVCLRLCFCQKFYKQTENITQKLFIMFLRRMMRWKVEQSNALWFD